MIEGGKADDKDKEIERLTSEIVRLTTEMNKNSGGKTVDSDTEFKLKEKIEAYNALEKNLNEKKEQIQKKD